MGKEEPIRRAVLLGLFITVGGACAPRSLAHFASSDTAYPLDTADPLRDEKQIATVVDRHGLRVK